MPFGTDDPNVQDLLQRNAQLGKPPDPLQFSSPASQMPQLQGRNLPVPVPPPPEQQVKRPGGFKSFLATMLAGGADAALKQSTGMNYVERQQAQQDIAYKQQQTEQLRLTNEMAPQLKQAQINALTAQPRFDPKTGQFLGVMNDAQFTQYVRGQGAAAINAGSREAVADKNQKPDVLLGRQYVQQLQTGDQLGAAKTLEQIKALSTATKAGSSVAPSMSRWVAALNDPATPPQEKAIAAKNIQMLQGLQEQQQEARGRSFAYNRGLYSWQVITDPDTGVVRPAQGWEVLQYQKAGNQVTASGRLSAKDQLAVQQLSSEAAPAIEKVRSNLSAYDNGSDRAIFARVIHDAGIPRYGTESTWMGNVLNQALKEGLSPQGQALVRDLSRLNETVGRFRTIMGAPSTDTQMSLAMAMLPGPSTPSSAYAEEQLKNFEQMVKLGVGVPILKGSNAGTGTPSAIDDEIIKAINAAKPKGGKK